MTSKIENKNKARAKNIVDASYKSESTELHGPAQPQSFILGFNLVHIHIHPLLLLICRNNGKHND
jgi:hypothetical protein